MEHQKLDPRVVAALAAVQLVVGALTLRDLAGRTPDQVRGPIWLWRIWGGSNTLGSVAYWTVGRR